MLSQTAEYALRAMVHLARHEPGKIPIQADDIAEALDVPRNYLSKILHALAREGFLLSTRGPGGGFRLAASPDELPLGRIVGVFDSHLMSEEGRCLMGRAVCSDDDGCPAHERWKLVAKSVRGFFRHTTLADLADGAEDAGLQGRAKGPRGNPAPKEGPAPQHCST